MTHTCTTSVTPSGQVVAGDDTLTPASARRGCYVWPALFAAVWLTALPAYGENSIAWHDPAEIAAAAVAFAEQHAVNGGAKRTISTRPVDPRVRLKRCGQSLEAFLPPGGRIRHHGVVGVRCSGPVGWKVYVSIAIETRSHVARLTRALPPGHRLTQSDIDWVEQAIQAGSTVLQQGVQDPVGQVLRTAGGSGQLLRVQMLRAAHVVRRGERVTLAAGGPAMAIRMQGEALANAAMGQRVRAKNLSSGRIVEGVVRDDGLVEIDIF